MKTGSWILATVICFSGVPAISFGQAKAAQSFKGKTNSEVKAFFYKLDDAFNLAMASKDSLFFINSLADSFINCTPVGEVNSKSEEISTLLHLPFTRVERTALKFDIFNYSDELAAMSVTKKITRNDAGIVYVRRTIVYGLIEGKWLIVAGQGTSVSAIELGL